MCFRLKRAWLGPIRAALSRLPPQTRGTPKTDLPSCVRSSPKAPPPQTDAHPHRSEVAVRSSRPFLRHGSVLRLHRGLG